MCITRSEFAWSMAVMGGVLCVAALLCTVLYLRTRSLKEESRAIEELTLEKMSTEKSRDLFICGQTQALNTELMTYNV